jgi:hypothetical protein
VAPATNREPLTVKTAVVPTVPKFGLTLSTVGFAESTVNATEFDIPPPGPGLETCIVAGPTVASRGSVKVRVVEFENPVRTGAPLSRIWDDGTKPVP